MYPQTTCPHCGYCPHCGRAAAPAYFQGPIWIAPQHIGAGIYPQPTWGYPYTSGAGNYLPSGTYQVVQ